MAIDPKTGDIGVDDERYVLDTVTTRIDWLSLECWGCAFSRRYFQGAIFNALFSMRWVRFSGILLGRSVLHSIHYFK